MLHLRMETTRMTDGTRLRSAPDARLPAGPGSEAVATVTLRVLGGFEATIDGRPLQLGGPRPRAVLARMLVADGSAVPAEQIVEDVWGDTGGSTAASVHVYVSRLRRALGGSAIVRRVGGYVVDRSVVSVDADEFTADLARGRRALARGDADTAGMMLAAALERWAVPVAFGELTSLPFLEIAAARLAELRISAAETLADVNHRC